MKVLQVNVVYKNGSTGKIVSCIREGLLKNGIDSVICYGRKSRVAEQGVYKVSSEFEAKVHSVLSRLDGVDFAHSPYATKRLERIIRKEAPDIVHLHCINGHFVNAYSLLNYLKIHRIKTVLTLHAEIMQTAGCEHTMGCGKWKTECYQCSRIHGSVSGLFRDDARHCFRRMKAAFDGFENLRIIGVSEWLTALAKESPIFKGANCSFETIRNGIDTSIFHYTNPQNLYDKYRIPKEKKIVLHVTPNFKYPIKGGENVLRLAKKMKEYCFIIVGYNDELSKLPQNAIGIRHTNDQKELAAFYSLADCFICTSLSESLPTVCLEAAACGTPIVGFDIDGVKEAIPPNGGTVVPIGDIEAFAEQIRQACHPQEKRERKGNARDFTAMVSDYMDVYRELLQ